MKRSLVAARFAVRTTTMKIVKSLVAAAVLVTGSIAASAQAPAPAATPAPAAQPAMPAAKAAAPKAGVKKATTPEGIECSAQADAKNLHGAERKKFRNACIKQIKAAAKAAKSAPAAAAPAAAPAAKKN